MKLLTLYSLASGLKIERQYMADAFYPLPFEKYVTIQSGSGMASKNYPHYAEVLALLEPTLSQQGIRVVQLGGKDDRAITGIYQLQGATTLHQANYLLGRSLCHIGNDSWMAHRAGELGVPLVAMFGPTTVANHGPYRADPQRTKLIESHRFGRRATFAAQESQSTMAVIPPETVANAVIELLGGTPVERKSLFIGEVYHQGIVEIVPDIVVSPSINVPGAMIVRMDHVANDGGAGWKEAEDKLVANLQIRKCSIVTDRELNLNILAQLRAQVAGIRVEVDGVGPDWIRTLKRLGISCAFYSSEQDPEKLANLRLKLYEVCLFDHFVPPTRADFVKSMANYLNLKVDSVKVPDKLWFKTNKMLLSQNQVFLSEAHWRAGKSTPSSSQNIEQVIDDPKFWAEQAHAYIFTQP